MGSLQLELKFWMVLEGQRIGSLLIWCLYSIDHIPRPTTNNDDVKRSISLLTSLRNLLHAVDAPSLVLFYLRHRSRIYIPEYVLFRSSSIAPISWLNYSLRMSATPVTTDERRLILQCLARLWSRTFIGPLRNEIHTLALSYNISLSLNIHFHRLTETLTKDETKSMMKPEPLSEPRPPLRRWSSATTHVTDEYLDTLPMIYAFLAAARGMLGLYLVQLNVILDLAHGEHGQGSNSRLPCNSPVLARESNVAAATCLQSTLRLSSLVIHHLTHVTVFSNGQQVRVADINVLDENTEELCDSLQHPLQQPLYRSQFTLEHTSSTEHPTCAPFEGDSSDSTSCSSDPPMPRRKRSTTAKSAPVKAYRHHRHAHIALWVVCADLIIDFVGFLSTTCVRRGFGMCDQPRAPQLPPSWLTSAAGKQLMVSSPKGN